MQNNLQCNTVFKSLLSSTECSLQAFFPESTTHLLKRAVYKAQGLLIITQYSQTESSSAQSYLPLKYSNREGYNYYSKQWLMLAVFRSLSQYKMHYQVFISWSYHSSLKREQSSKLTELLVSTKCIKIAVITRQDQKLNTVQVSESLWEISCTQSTDHYCSIICSLWCSSLYLTTHPVRESSLQRLETTNHHKIQSNNDWQSSSWYTMYSKNYCSQKINVTDMRQMYSLRRTIYV